VPAMASTRRSLGSHGSDPLNTYDLALGLKPIERPPITKTNIVCAEPMPGEIDMLREFTAGLTPKVLGQFFDDLTDDEFWTRAENDIAEALELYARQAENGQPFQRRLFADDTIQGFAFADICQKRYDVVLMNPPFGDASIQSKDYIEEVYGDTKGDVYKTFIECFQDRLVPCGMLGMISSSAGFFLAQSTRPYQDLRCIMPPEQSPSVGGVYAKL
jgi:hypothetical protein